MRVQHLHMQQADESMADDPSYSQQKKFGFSLFRDPGSRMRRLKRDFKASALSRVRAGPRLFCLDSNTSHIS